MELDREAEVGLADLGLQEEGERGEGPRLRVSDDFVASVFRRKREREKQRFVSELSTDSHALSLFLLTCGASLATPMTCGRGEETKL